MTSSCAAGFIFLLCALAVLFQVIGFGVPGWLSVETRQTVTDDNAGGKVSYALLYQDYSLWYVTQCDWNDDGFTYTCNTRSYRLTDHLHEVANRKVEIENIGRATLFFSGYGLIFSTSQIYTMQTLYTIGTLISILLLLTLHCMWKKASKGRYTSKVITTVVMALLGIVSGLFTLVPVGMFGSAASKLDENVESSLGIAFGGLGGSLLILVAVVILFSHFGGCLNGENTTHDEAKMQNLERERSNADRL